MDGASGEQGLDGIITSLIGQVLAGDTDAIGLLHTPATQVTLEGYITVSCSPVCEARGIELGRRTWHPSL